MKKGEFITILTYIIFAVAITACNNGKNNIANSEEKSHSMEYAQLFSIDESKGEIKEIIVCNSWNGATKEDKYTLVPKDCTTILANNPQTIPYPVERVVCMSSSHVAFLASLEQEKMIKGISGTYYINNPKVKELIEKGEILDVGSEELPNYERIIALKPDVVIAYGVTGNSNSYIAKLQQYGIKVLTIGEYLENDPLGKLEYIKLFGLLTGKKAMADSIFNDGCSKYLQIKEHIAENIESTDRTKVLINLPYKGIWMVSGEKNYINNLINDAGGTILGARKNTAASTQTSFEEIYSIALQADVWLHTNMTNTLKELEKENPLFKNFKPFKQNRIYNNTLIVTPDGGSAFWETGVIEPHIILQDLAQILHPELYYGELDLHYYRKVE